VYGKSGCSIRHAIETALDRIIRSVGRVGVGDSTAVGSLGSTLHLERGFGLAMLPSALPSTQSLAGEGEASNLGTGTYRYI
jgi:hypothetical protein